jgi:DNA-binding NtrC family response regulator
MSHESNPEHGAAPESRKALRVLVVDDEPTLRDSCMSVLSYDGYDVVGCGRGDEARALLQRPGFDIVLVDLNMSQVGGLELLRTCLEAKPDAIVIVMTGNADVESSIEAMRAGAWDYLPKPFTATHLQILLGRAKHSLALNQERVSRDVDREREFGHSKNLLLLGRSPAFLKTIELAQRVARTDASVFITGESGSGKEMIAQYIHAHGRRSSHAMVAVNCAALPETLLESEMFGHVKGAFTGAVRDKPGLLETANGGTFFLDELTEMSQPVQAKLLRVIQDGVVRRVGSESVDAIVNVRFIAATNSDPREAVEKGVLRKDLYFRLSVVPIEVPPLRDRVEDIPVLADHFLSLYWKKHRERSAPLPSFSRAAIRELQARPWNGNVRELQNAMEHMVVLLDPGGEIQPADIPYLDDPPGGRDGSSRWSGYSEMTEVEYHVARERVLADFEMHYISELIDRAGANMSKAAKIAGVDRTTLYRLLEKHGLQRDTVIRAN